MQAENQTSDKTKRIENLLDSVFEDLLSLTEDNFNQSFHSAKSKMDLAGEIKVENSSKYVSFKSSKKIIQMAKLISDKYDNIIKDWAERLKLVQKEIELTQNQKKITIYKR